MVVDFSPAGAEQCRIAAGECHPKLAWRLGNLGNFRVGLTAIQELTSASHRNTNGRGDYQRTPLSSDPLSWVALTALRVLDRREKVEPKT